MFADAIPMRVQRDAGHRLLAAPIGSGGSRLLSPLHWPREVPRSERRIESRRGLISGRHHVYAMTEPTFRRRTIRRTGVLPDDHVVALRHGAVLWRLPLHLPLRPVPTGDQVLLVDSNREHDRLRMVDGDTGAFVGA